MWRPENYSGRAYGPTRLREALIRSRNLISIRLLHRVGVPWALQHIEKFGFDTEKLPANLSLALGSGAVTPWRLAGAYCILANGGFRTEPYFIDRIESYNGDIVYQSDPAVVCRDCPAPEAESPADRENAPAGPPAPATQTPAGEAAAPAQTQAPKLAERVVAPQIIWIMQSMMRDVIEHGTGRRARSLQRPDLAGKTGTTNDQRDAWFSGFNSSIVTISWVGFDKFQPLGNAETGARAALPMWVKYMEVALEDIPQSIPDPPPGLVNIRINRKTGLPASSDDPDAFFETFRVEYAPEPGMDTPDANPYDPGNAESISPELF